MSDDVRLSTSCILQRISQDGQLIEPSMRVDLPSYYGNRLAAPGKPFLLDPHLLMKVSEKVADNCGLETLIDGV